MNISMYQASTPRFAQMLRNLSAILDKAQAHVEAKKLEPSVLTTSRLFPDMFPLTRQVQIACDQAKGAVARLAGLEIPKHEDTEQTLAELKARIAKTLDYVNSFKAADIDAAEAKDVTFPAGPQKTMTLKGDAFVIHVVLPNFYFHVMAAYAIMRHCGVDVGKIDFLGAIPMKMV